MMNLEEIPPGYRFSPTDEELITYYLRKKSEGEDMTWFNHVISEQDLYGELPPWVFFKDGAGSTSNAEEDDHIRYFYTKLKKKHESGEKIHRTLGKNGEYCWDGQDLGTYIYDHRTNTAIGKKKLFSLIRSNKKKGRCANSNNEKGKKSSSSKDIHVDDGNNESFGNWIMHQYSLVNYPSSSKDNPKYVICRIRMKAPPKHTTTGGNATTHRHDSINSTVARLALSSCSTHGYQNMSNQILLHDQQQQQQQEYYLPDADHVAVPPPLVLPIETDYQINHQDQGYLLQQRYAYVDDQLMFQHDELQQQLLLMCDQEHSLANMEASLMRSMSEWESRRLDNGGADAISSSHDQLLQVDNFSANMEVLSSSVLLSNSMVDLEEENRFIMNNGGGHGAGGGGGTTSDQLDYNSTTTAAAGGVNNLDNGQTGLADYDTIMNSNNGRTGLPNYDTVMNSLKEDTTFNDLIWDSHWVDPNSVM